MDLAFSLTGPTLRLPSGHDVAFEWIGVGRGDETALPAPSTPHVQGAEIRYPRGHVTEWYLNGPLGLEQGFEIGERPAGGGPPLTFWIAVNGDLTPSARGGRVDLLDGMGITRAHYGELFVEDADRMAVPAHIEVHGSYIALVIDDAHARYPLSVDPFAWVQDNQIGPSDMPPGSEFGASVSIDGDTAIVGAFSADDVGAAYVFVRSGNLWVEQQKLVAPDGQTSDLFGLAVAVSNDTAVIGAYGDDDNGDFSGSAYVFTRSGATWSFQQKLLPSTFQTAAYFGRSVAVEGDTVIVGAERQSTATTFSGAAYVFVRSGTTWSEQQRLEAPDPTLTAEFGSSVSLSGATALIGAANADGAAVESGAAYVFVSNAGVWAQEAKLQAGAADDRVGTSVALNGDIAVVGASGNDDNGSGAGAGFVFTRSGATWSLPQKLLAMDGMLGDFLGQATAVSGDLAVLGGSGFDSDQGAAYVFARVGNVWSQQYAVRADDGQPNQRFGRAVALQGTMLFVGDNSSAYFFDQVEVGQACSNGGTCITGNCVDGVCCDTLCGGGATDDCLSCAAADTGGSDGVCAPIAAGTVCRASTDLCDAADACDGINDTCPADALEPAGTTCRPAASPCDAEEQCDGSLRTCPADGVAAAGITCRAAAGPCDVADTCDGVSMTCSMDEVAPAGMLCRPATGPCDVDDVCDGASPACNDGSVAPDSPCDDGNACTEGDRCVGSTCEPGADVCEDDPPADQSDDDSGCSCETAGALPSANGAPALFMVLLLACAARRRRVQAHQVT